MARKKPAPRIVVQRSNNNVKRRLVVTVPNVAERVELSNNVRYGAYSKHKYNPIEYGLTPYAGPDSERTYCDRHAGFCKADILRIGTLLKRGVMLGLISEQSDQDAPRLLWTIDDNGWIYELRITNTGQLQYHGYPVLPADAFARHVLVRAREVLTAEAHLPEHNYSSALNAIAAAETHYR